MFRRLLRSLVLDLPVDEDIDEISRFLIPENFHLLTPPGAYLPTYRRSESTYKTDGKYAYQRRIDGHPDLHDYLWDRAGARIPRECCWVIRATASFAHPGTNIVFATTGGNHGLRIRLSQEHATAFDQLERDAVAADPGYTWVHSRLEIEEDRAMLETAHSDAATRNIATEPGDDPKSR